MFGKQELLKQCAIFPVVLLCCLHLSSTCFNLNMLVIYGDFKGKFLSKCTEMFGRKIC